MIEHTTLKVPRFNTKICASLPRAIHFMCIFQITYVLRVIVVQSVTAFVSVYYLHVIIRLV